ncbi:phycobilisome protein [Leptolyngbya sp. Heron Island J]|uniref:phycobilisome protein n=1 Tax=Leptolyngbya sp. Heron Island J TaxID=1385935 RepID=UPI0003B9848C|nr:phycobilisome protein [Leptolyngbya sp. Heron Island J]ESA36144.1 phycobilisome protein [Leptolyngbya sp. Heron Island J]
MTTPSQHILRQIELQPDRSYLTAQELSNLGRYVGSLADRVRAYRQLREWEVNLLQELVDRLPAELKENQSSLEQSIKQTILILRYAALGMLADDVNLGRRRLEGWLPTMVSVYQTQAIDTILQRYLNQQLPRLLTDSQFALLKPALEAAQQLLQAEE